MHLAASTYNQLGRIAEEERDFEIAREWYLKSLAISERHRDLHLVTLTYGALGILEGYDGHMKLCADWLIRAIRGFLESADERNAEALVRNFAIFFNQASKADKIAMKSAWEQANLGSFPTLPDL